jgi:hypothetical protein
VCDPNLERVDLFASPVQTVEDSLGVRERAIVAAVETHEREYLPEQVSGNRRSRHRDRSCPAEVSARRPRVCPGVNGC